MSFLILQGELRVYLLETIASCKKSKKTTTNLREKNFIPTKGKKTQISGNT